MSQAVDALKICLIRIKCGQSFSQASKDLQFPIKDKGARLFAQDLFQKILSQSIPAQSGVEALREHLLLLEKSRALLSSKTLMPKMQSKVLGFLGILVIVLSPIVMPSEMSPKFVHLALSSLLIGLALYFSFKMSKALERYFWFSSWMQLLSLWRT